MNKASVTREADVDTELRETVARYEAILASTLDPIITIDAFGTIQSASDSVQRVFGYAPDELVGSKLNVLMPEPHRSQHDEYLDRYRRTGETNILGATRELQGRHRDGRIFPIEVSISRVDVPGRSQPLFTGIIHDITSRKQADRESELLRRLVFGVSEADTLESALVVALKEICHLTGWDYGEAWLPASGNRVLHSGPHWFSPSPTLQIFRDGTEDLVLELGQGLPGRVLASGRPEWIRDVSSSDVSTFLRSEMARRAGLRAGFAMPVLADDEIAAVLAFYMSEPQERDSRLMEVVSAAVAPLGAVIHRRRAEAALHESERRFRQMLNQTDLLAVMLDQFGRVTFCNDYLLALAGWNRNEIVGQDWFDLMIPAGEREAVRDVFRKGMATGEIARHFENSVRTRTGRTRRIAWSNTTMCDHQGGVIGATALGIDVTEQRQLEDELTRHREQLEHLVAERTAELEATHEQLRLADRLASIGTLAAGLGHDMNNILFPARCRIEALEAAGLADREMEHLRALRWSIGYLQQLTDGLRLFALDPDDLNASTDRTDLSSWWRQTGSLLCSATPRSARVDVRIPDGLPNILVAPHRLTQAVLNLISNAGDAIGEGGAIRIRARLVEDGRFIKLSVVDNGCGMSDEVRRNALDPFYTTKTRGLGTGLGLSLVFGVAQSSGGSLSIRSRKGLGTVVMMVLPIACRDHQTPAASPTAVVSVRDPRAATLIEAMLHTWGFVTRISTDEEPADAELWVAEPELSSEEARRRFAAHPGRRVVAFGAPDANKRVYCHHMIEYTDDFGHIRRVLRDAVEEIREVV